MYTTNSTGSEITAQRYLYGYDVAWNMVKRTNNTTISTYTMNNLNQDDTEHGWDSNGNRIYDDQADISYTYNDENRLILVESPESWQVQYKYDARGRLRYRATFTWGDTDWEFESETRHLYDGMLLVQERTSANAPSITYTWGLDLSGPAGAGQGAGGKDPTNPDSIGDMAGERAGKAASKMPGSCEDNCLKSYPAP